MALQLQHVFTGVGVRPWKPQGQTVVDGLALVVLKRQITGLARLQGPAEQGLHKRRQALARHPHNAHRTTTGGGGNGNDGVVLFAQHGEILRQGRFRNEKGPQMQALASEVPHSGHRRTGFAGLPVSSPWGKPLCGAGGRLISPVASI